MIGASLNMIGPTIDMIWVGRLSSAAIAGVGVGGMAVMMINSLISAICMGVRAIVARFMGAGDEEGAAHASRQAYLLGIVFSLVMIPLGLFVAEPVMSLFGVEPDVVVEGSKYLRLLLIGSGTNVLWMMTESIMQSSGDSISPMRIVVFFRVLHVGLCPALIFGWWIFPQLGVEGAALTNVISQGLGLIIGTWVLLSGRSRLHLTLKNFRIDPVMMKRIIKIGIPVAITGAQRSLGDMVIMWFISPFGTAAVAAHTIWQRIMMFNMMPGMGFGTGAAVLAGQNMGADKPDRAERSGWLASGLVVAWMFIGGVLMLIFPEQIIGIFGPDPDVVELGADFLRIGAVALIVFGFEPVLQNVLCGVGDTLSPMCITFGTFCVFQVPLAWALSNFTGLGVYGVRWGIVLGMMASGVGMALAFKSGRWKKKKV
jgi:putative MATE family efflux protein